MLTRSLLCRDRESNLTLPNRTMLLMAEIRPTMPMLKARAVAAETTITIAGSSEIIMKKVRLPERVNVVRAEAAVAVGMIEIESRSQRIKRRRSRLGKSVSPSKQLLPLKKQPTKTVRPIVVAEAAAIVDSVTTTMAMVLQVRLPVTTTSVNTTRMRSREEAEAAVVAVEEAEKEVTSKMESPITRNLKTQVPMARTLVISRTAEVVAAKDVVAAVTERRAVEAVAVVAIDAAIISKMARLVTTRVPLPAKLQRAT